MKLPTQHLTAEFAAGDANRDTRVVPMTVYAGATVIQFNFENGLHELTLGMKPENVRLSRLNSGRAPFTKGHADSNDPEATIGVLSNARLVSGNLKADVRFSKRPDVEPLYNDVLDGVLANVSVGARILKMKETTAEGAELKSFLATEWEPFAVALVGLGADPGAHFGAADQIEQTECEVEFSQQGDFMEQTNTNDNTAVADLALKQKIAATLGLGGEFLLSHSEKPLAQFRTLAIDEQARLANTAGGEIRHVHAEITRDEREGLVGRMAEGLAARYTGKAPSDGARQYAGARVADLAREICRTNGLRATGFGSENFVRLAMGTSDFPELLQGTGRRMLLNAYEAAQPAIKQVARRSTAQDFRTKALLRLGEAPSLSVVAEGGEVTHGARAESKESYRIYEYARIYGLTRQAIINDDLGAFNDYVSAYGVASAQLEGQKLAELLTTNSGLGPLLGDAVPLFDAAAHKNYLASGTAIDITNLGIARTAMRVQTGLDGQTIINVTPKYLVTSAAKETLAEQYLAQLAAATATDANPFTNKLTLVVVPEFDAASVPTNWLLFGDPGIAPVCEYSWLEGNEGPQVEIKPGWETLGVEYRCVMSWGCGIVGFRGVYKNVGA